MQVDAKLTRFVTVNLAMTKDEWRLLTEYIQAGMHARGDLKYTDDKVTINKFLDDARRAISDAEDDE